MSIEEKMIKSKELASFIGRSTRSIYNYEASGLIDPPTRDSSNWRKWSIQEACIIFLKVNKSLPSVERVVSVLYDVGYRDESLVSAMVIKLNLKGLVQKWS